MGIKSEMPRSCSRSSDHLNSIVAERLRWSNRSDSVLPPPAIHSSTGRQWSCFAKESSLTVPTTATGAEQTSSRSCGEQVTDIEINYSFKERIQHFTPAWFLSSMAAGGIANMLHAVPFRFRGLYAMGCVFLLLNISLFVGNVAMISCRFYHHPKTFKASFLLPAESLSMPAVVSSFGMILVNVTQYGVSEGGMGQRLEKCMIVLFWCNCCLAISFSVIMYLVLWSKATFDLTRMTASWVNPAYSCLITGSFAGNLTPKVSNPETALAIILGGYVILGIGFLISLMVYATFFYRLMTQKLPAESMRPAMFVSVGPLSTTITVMINLGRVLPKVVPPDFMVEGEGELAGRVGMICANFVGLWLWGLAFWFFFVSVGSILSCAVNRSLGFAMTWYTLITPNTALTTATFAIARALNGNRTVQCIGCVLTIGLVIMWSFVAMMNIRAIIFRRILWPQLEPSRTGNGQAQQVAAEQRREPDEEMGRGRRWSQAPTEKPVTLLGPSDEKEGRLTEKRALSLPRVYT